MVTLLIGEAGTCRARGDVIRIGPILSIMDYSVNDKMDTIEREGRDRKSMASAECAALFCPA